MKKLIITVVFLCFLASCSKKVSDIDAALKDGIAAGEWNASKTAGGFDNFNSFKNYSYNFEVIGSNQIVAINLSSIDIDVQYALFDPNGSIIESSSSGKNISKEYTLNAGTYRVAVTAKRQAIGKFSLKINGAKDGFSAVSFNTLTSETQNWGSLGGGGVEKTFKNHFYTFEVTDDNTMVDIELSSSETDVTLYLYDALGSLVGTAGGDRYAFILKPVKKGTYSIMTGTFQRGNVGSYNANLFGKVQNLKRVASSAETKTGIWDAGRGEDVVHTYTLDITSTGNSPLDMELSSPEANVMMMLQTGDGAYINNTATTNKTDYYVSKDLPKGKYRLLVRPYSTRNGGNYTLIINGQFSNLKKI